VTDLADVRIPVAMRPTAEHVIALTDKVCADLLDEAPVGLTWRNATAAMMAWRS